MALGGFASVAAALGRPLGAIRRQRFLALLFLSLTQVLSCLIPLWLVQLEVSPTSVWRLASLLGLLIAAATITFTVILPLRRIGYLDARIQNPLVLHFLNATSAVSVLLLPLNAAGFPWEPGFGPYYASLLLGFSVGFVLFADVVLLTDSSS